MSMPTVSERGATIPFSAMRKFSPIAAKVAASGVKLVKLNIGQPDILTPEPFWQAVADFPKKEKTLAYAPSNGRPELVEALVSYYAKYDINLTKEQVLVTVGGCEALLIVMMAITNVGDDILVVEPFYSNYSGCAAMSGVTLNAITTTPASGYRLPSREEVEAQITPKTRAILYASPGNPSGTVYTQAELDMLGAVCRDRGLFLIGDEVYREFSYDEDTPVPPSALQLPNFEEYGIIIDSASKRYSACGARIGCVASKNNSLMKACVRLATVRLSAPALEQIGVAACINDPNIDDYTKGVIGEYIQRRDLVVSAIAKMEGISCVTPKGAFYLIATIDGIDTDDLVRWFLEEFRDNNETLMVSPVAGFYKTAGLGVNDIRIAYVLNLATLKRAMELLDKGVQQYRATHKRSTL